MKKIVCTFLVFFSSLSIAQDISDLADLGGFDKDYLESLPKEIRDDLLDKVGAKNKLNEPVYRQNSTMVDKPKDELEIFNESKRFGANIFDTMQTSFMPLNEPNTDDRYILGIGDELEVQLIGGKDQTKRYVINNDGSINLQDIGKLYLAGLSLSEASKLIKDNVNKVYTLTQAYTTLTSIRDIQVLVSGNAYNPGVYTLNGNSNPLHAITMAGGINENGSYRTINIIRDDVIIDTLDLYDIFIHGKSNFGPKLRSGDSVFVSSYNNLVNIFTGVKRPAQYELLDEETFADLIDYADGFTNYADTTSMSYERIKNGEIRKYDVDSSEDLSKILIEDGDAFFIPEYVLRSVTVMGAVNFPGEYSITEGEKLSNLIKRAGGYKSSAYPFAGHLENQRTMEINIATKEKLYSNFLEFLLVKTQIPGDSLPYVLSELKKAPVSGRLRAEFDLDLIYENPSLDTTLEDKDLIMIPYITEQVYVYGEVNNPGAVRYNPNNDISYYINGTGGVKRTADKKSVFIVHPDGSTNATNMSFLQSYKIGSENKIYPGSIIFIPKNTSLDTVQSAAVWGPIISSIALSLTSLSVLNNN